MVQSPDENLWFKLKMVGHKQHPSTLVMKNGQKLQSYMDQDHGHNPEGTWCVPDALRVSAGGGEYILKSIFKVE